MALWLGLPDVTVAERGDIAGAVRAELALRGGAGR